MIVPFLQIEPTTRCNYTCDFCVGRNMEQRDLSAADLERLLDGVEGLQPVKRQALRRIAHVNAGHAAAHLLGVRVHAGATDRAERPADMPGTSDREIIGGHQGGADG